MKIFNFCLCIIFIIISCNSTSRKPEELYKSTNVVNLTINEHDSIECKNIIINKAIHIATTIDQIGTILGKPDTTYNQINDEDDPPFEYVKLVYKKSYFNFHLKRLYEAEIKDSTFQVNGIKVGTSINSLEKIYQKSFNNLSDRKNNTIYIYCYGDCLADGKIQLSPQTILVEYEEKSNVIKKIIFGSSGGD